MIYTVMIKKTFRLYFKGIYFGLVAQFGRAFGSHSKGRGFDPLQVHQILKHLLFYKGCFMFIYTGQSLVL